MAERWKLLLLLSLQPANTQSPAAFRLMAHVCVNIWMLNGKIKVLFFIFFTGFMTQCVIMKRFC